MSNIETRLKKFAATLEKATPGPWEYNRAGEGDIIAGFKLIRGKMQADWIGSVDHDNADDIDSEGYSKQRHNDGFAMVTARNDGSTLAADALAEIERLKRYEVAFRELEDVLSFEVDDNAIVIVFGNGHYVSADQCRTAYELLKETI